MGGGVEMVRDWQVQLFSVNSAVRTEWNSILVPNAVRQRCEPLSNLAAGDLKQNHKLMEKPSRSGSICGKKAELKLRRSGARGRGEQIGEDRAQRDRAMNGI
eukprot:g19437.t1